LRFKASESDARSLPLRRDGVPRRMARKRSALVEERIDAGERDEHAQPVRYSRRALTYKQFAVAAAIMPRQGVMAAALPGG
jgi:hypothetical protein